MTAGGQGQLVTLFITVGLLIGAVLVGGVVLLVMRRRLLSKEGPSKDSLLGDLRRMRAEGRITPEEYDAARRAAVRAAAGERGGPPRERPGGGPQ